VSTDPTRIQPPDQQPPSDQTAAFSTDTPNASQSPQTQSDTRIETGAGATGAWAQQGTRAESPDNSNATANFTSGPVGRRASAVLQTSLGGYEIMGELGRGGMGVVYKAHQRGLNRVVALKMVLAGGHASEDQLKRFLAEARAVAHLQHPNIVQVFDIGENDGLPFFSLEYVDGEPLSRKLAKQPQPPKEAAAIMVVIAKAMQYAHDNKILHRDLKPANILLTSTGVPKIADFGLAKQIEDNDDGGATRTGTVIGTPSYMAPEQARGDTHVIGPPTDQYALGAMLYEMLTGRPPFAAARQVDTILQVIKNEPIPPRHLEEKIPADLETICLKSLQKDISKRYDSCGEFAADLERYLRGEPILARPVSNVERGIRWCRRNPLVAGLSAVAVASLIIVTCVSTWSAMTLSAKNTKLAAETARANLNAENEKKQAAIAKRNEAEAKKQEGIAKDNERKAKEQEAIAKENERKAVEQKKKTDEQADNLKKYMQSFLTESSMMDDIEAPQLRPFKKKLLDLSLASSEMVVEQLKNDNSLQAVPTRMGINQQLARVYRSRDEGEKAVKAIEDLIALGEERVKIQKGADAARHNLLQFLQEMALLKLEFGREMNKSLELAKRANQIAVETLANPRDNGPPENKGKAAPYMAKYYVAATLMTLGQTYYRMGDPIAASQSFQEALRLREEILATLDADPVFPTEAKQRQELVRRDLSDNSRSALAVGSALFRSGKFEEAEPYLDIAFQMVKKQMEARPRSPLTRLNYFTVAAMRAEFKAQAGKPDEAIEMLEEAVKLADEAVEFDPDGARVLRDASVAYYRLGQWREELGRSEADVMVKKALAIREGLFKKEPKSVKRKLEYAMVLGRAGDYEKCNLLAQELLDGGEPDGEMLVDLARSVAQASKHAPQERKADFLANAVDMVRRAKGQGFKDLVYLEKEIDFKPLWELPEFKAITAEIRAAQSAIDTKGPAKVE
jgi:serine/threonine protein kinase